MINEELVKYIQQQIKDGVDKEEIKRVLIEQGWQDGDINEGFAKQVGDVSDAEKPETADNTVVDNSVVSETGNQVKAVKSVNVKLIAIIASIIILILAVGVGAWYVMVKDKIDNSDSVVLEEDEDVEKAEEDLEEHQTIIQDFRNAIKNNSEEIFYQAVRDLKDRRDELFLQLLEILADKNESINIRFTLLNFILDDIDDKRATPILMNIIADKSEHRDFRKQSIVLVGKLKDSRAMDLLLNIAKDENEDSEIREYAIWNLGEVGDETTVDYIIQLTYEDNRIFKVPAILSLGEIGSSLAVDRLIELLDSNNKEDVSLAAKALQESNDDRAIDPLIDALEKNVNDTETRAVTIDSLMNALGVLKADAAVPILIEILNGKDDLSAVVAAENLAKIGDERAIEPLRTIIENTTDSYISKGMKEAYKLLTGVEYDKE